MLASSVHRAPPSDPPPLSHPAPLSALPSLSRHIPSNIPFRNVPVVFLLLASTFTPTLSLGGCPAPGDRRAAMFATHHHIQSCPRPHDPRRGKGTSGERWQCATAPAFIWCTSRTGEPTRLSVPQGLETLATLHHNPPLRPNRFPTNPPLAHLRPSSPHLASLSLPCRFPPRSPAS
jgi:hypothetical protein